MEICNTTSPCDITRIRTESNTLLTGVEHYDIVESCECHKLREHCAKVSLYKTFFPNSPFEVQIDVGTCRGDCVKGKDKFTEMVPKKNKKRLTKFGGWRRGEEMGRGRRSCRGGEGEVRRRAWAAKGQGDGECRVIQ